MSRVAASWLNDLAIVVAGSAPLADLKAKVAGMSGLLAEDYPPEAFSRASLAHVARQCKFFPSYGELTEHLSAWWKDHRPEPRLAITATDERTRQDQHSADCAADWASITTAQLREKIANVRAIGQSGMRLSWGRVLSTAIHRHAPHLAGLIPPEWLPEGDPPPDPLRPEPDERPRSVYLTPEQLALLRKPKVPA
jgi:hypothetical protein